MPRRKADAAAVVFALLVVATVAAFAYAQRVKRDPLLVDRVEIGHKKSNSFTPKGQCDRRIKLKFRTTTTNDHGTVEVIRPGGEIVSVLAKKEFLKRYTYPHLLLGREERRRRDPAAGALPDAGDARRRRA